jgi:hypothetical protein
MKGHIFLEFLIAFLTMILIVQFLMGSQENSLKEIGKKVTQTNTKMELEKMAAACNLVYFNWKSANLSFYFSLPNLRISGNKIISEENGTNLTSECLSNMSGVAGLGVSGVRRWF